MKKKSTEGKVVHISGRTHKALKRFCDARGLQMTPLVEEAIKLAMQAFKEVEREL